MFVYQNARSCVHGLRLWRLGVYEEHLKAAHSTRLKAVNKKRFTQKRRLKVIFQITSRRVSVKILEVSWTYRQLLACSLQLNELHHTG